MTQRAVDVAPAPIDSEVMLEARGVSHSFGKTLVLSDVDVTVRRHEVVGLIGPNGSGKTTLLRMLSGALRPDAGAVSLTGEPIAALSARQVARRLALVVQHPPSDMALSVADMVLLGRTPHLGPFSWRDRRDEDLAITGLERVGALHLAHRDMSELSGGERQRVLIARALVQEPECLLMDEPTNHLDIGYQHQILDLVRGLGTTALLVLHDLNLAARYCDRLVLLDRGHVRASGLAPDVLGPALIQTVYGVAAESRISTDGTAQLLYRRPDHAPDA